MTEISFQVNPAAALQVRVVGQEKTPIVLIDDFALDTTELIDHACNLVEYGPDRTSAYPGIRGKLPRNYVRSVLDGIHRLLFQVFSVPENLAMRPVNAVYSLIAQQEHELSLAQRVPHFDSSKPYYLAILHYLNPGDFCDTGLFRHRPTGFEKILAQRQEEFFRTSQSFLEENGPPPQNYINDSTAHFELYERIEYKPNRLVVYPGCLLHSGLVNPAVDINADPRTGRLTANLFVDFSEIAGAQQ